MNTAVVTVEEQLVCGLTGAQIEALKKQHGFLVIVTIEQGGVELKEKISELEKFLTANTKEDANRKTAETDLAAAKDKFQKEHTFNAIFKEPTFAVLEATGAIGKDSEIKGTVALYDNCIVKVDNEISNRDFAKLKSLEGLAKHMNSFSVSVKNL
jgi:hypothetical protein